jgi:hypothetical protein
VALEEAFDEAFSNSQCVDRPFKFGEKFGINSQGEDRQLNSAAWSSTLQKAYNDKTEKRRGVRLPSANYIQFDGEDHVTVTMKERAVLANMQTDEAAFEGWSLALRFWCKAKSIELNWELPSASCKETQLPHYQRFLYRAERFMKLFPEWFSLSRPIGPTEAEALGDGPFFLNIPGDRSQLDGSEAPIEAIQERESDVEKRLNQSDGFKTYFGLKKVDRQLPVGLFRESVAKKNRIFTGGKSAIDLVGVGKETFHLFELKVGKNAPVGILSELLFYTSVIREVIPTPARFQFDPSWKSRGTHMSPGDVLSCTRIEAVLLAEELHPLLENSNIIELLNQAADEHWNKESGHVPIHFRAVILKGSGKPEYEFVDLR